MVFLAPLVFFPYTDLPCERKFFSYMAVSVHEVVRVALLQRFLTWRKQTNYATDKPNERLRKR